ncbi:MAG: hypothetical protein ACKVE3_06950 [Dissulfuribacterales bacterium]
MYLDKIIIVMLLFSSIAYAYDEEAGLSEDEMYSVIFDSFNTYNDIDNPKWYTPITDYLVKFEAYFTDNAPTIEIEVTVKKLTWNYNLNNYEETGDNYISSHTIGFHSNSTEKPIFWIDPVEAAFRDNPDMFKNFVTPDQNLDHPDILNVTVDIDAEGTELDRFAQGYETITEEEINNLKGSIGEDHGFSLTGEGGEGGLGDIYDVVNDDGISAGGMDDTFKSLFYGIIPILFILSILNMITKVL